MLLILALGRQRQVDLCVQDQSGLQELVSGQAPKLHRETLSQKEPKTKKLSNLTAVKMAQQVKALVAKPDDMNCVPGTCMAERTDSHKL